MDRVNQFRNCLKKKRFRTLNGATLAAKRINKRLNESGETFRLEPYECGFCNGAHLTKGNTLWNQQISEEAQEKERREQGRMAFETKAARMYIERMPTKEMAQKLNIPQYDVTRLIWSWKRRYGTKRSATLRSRLKDDLLGA